MALPELLEALRQDAARRREEIERASRDTEARTRAESDARLRRRRAEYLARAEGEATEAARRILARARVDALREVLAARSRMLARVRTGVEERVRRADRDSDFVDSVVPDVERALARLPAGPAVVRTTAPLVAPLKRALVGRRNVTVVESDGASPGFVVESEAGMDVDGRLSTRLEQGWSHLAVSVLAEARR